MNSYMALMVGLDSQKQVTIVTSYKLLGFFGDIGGFQEALSIFLEPIGTFFSA